jgi:hypothetical protein
MQEYRLFRTQGIKNELFITTIRNAKAFNSAQ